MMGELLRPLPRSTSPYRTRAMVLSSSLMKPAGRSCDMSTRIFTSMLAATAAAYLGALASEAPAAQQGAAAKPVLPVFEVDYKFPTMPDKKLLGGVGGATADSHGNVWVFHRPHTLEEGNATENGWGPAPPVLEFSADGKYLQG